LHLDLLHRRDDLGVAEAVTDCSVRWPGTTRADKGASARAGTDAGSSVTLPGPTFEAIEIPIIMTIAASETSMAMTIAASGISGTSMAMRIREMNAP
jgi:hypothetical protein